MSLQSRPIPSKEYTRAGRTFRYGLIGVGIIAWFLAFASIWWLIKNTKKERDN